MLVAPGRHAPALAQGNDQRQSTVSSWMSRYHVSSAEPLSEEGTDGKLLRVCVRGSREQHALKVPRRGRELSIEDIEEEHAIIKRVQGHPCMVQLVSIFIGEAHASAQGIQNKRVAPCMSMQLAAEDLSRFLHRQHRGCPPAKIIDLFCDQLLDGAAHMHGLGIIHRDIKPANVLVPKSVHFER